MLTLAILFVSCFAVIAHHRKRSRAKIKPATATAIVYPLKSPTTTPFRLAIITPLANRTQLDLIASLKTHLAGKGLRSYTIIPVEGKNCRVTIYENTLTALKNADALLTYGLTCTNIALEALKARSSGIPLFWTGVKPTHLTQLHERATNYTSTGLVCQDDTRFQVSTLRSFKPSLRTVLILFRPQTKWHHSAAQILTQEFSAQGITVTTYPVALENNIVQQIEAVLAPKTDTIMIMQSTLNGGSLATLAQHCSNQGITLCAQEQDACLLGAAISFCNPEAFQIITLTPLIRNQLEQPSAGPIQHKIPHLDRYEVHLNQRTAIGQQIRISPAFTALANRTHYTEPTNYTTAPL